MSPTRRFATKKEAVETYLLENPTATPSELAEKVTKETGIQVKGNRVSQIKLDMKSAGRFPPPQSRAAPVATPRVTVPPTPQAGNGLPPVTPVNSTIPPQAKGVPDAAVKDEEDEDDREDEGRKPSLAEKVSALRALIAAVGPNDAHCLIGLLGRLGHREGGRAVGHLVLDTVIDLGEVEANQLVEVLA
jgi:hypothetical protein